MLFIFALSKLDNYEACLPLSLQRVYLAANINPYILLEIVDLDLPRIISHKLIILHELNKINICDICGSYSCSDCPVNSPTSGSPAARGSILIFVAILAVLKSVLNRADCLAASKGL